MIRQLFFLCAFFFVSQVIATERPIVILFSDYNESFRAPAEAFKKKQNGEVLEYHLKGSLPGEAGTMDLVMRQKPSIIFALGARAAWFAKTATAKHLSTKVIFAMVINWQRYELLDGQRNIVGISTDIAPGTQLFNLSLLSPKIKKVGVVYSESYSAEVVEQAQNAANLLGLELISEPIGRAKMFKRVWRKMSKKIDAYWVLTDPVLYTLENIHWLSERCLKEKIVCVGQSQNITKLGILLSINPDEENLGVQAAALAKSILSKTDASVLGKVYSPIGTQVTLNQRTAKKIGVTVDSEVLSLINDVVK